MARRAALHRTGCPVHLGHVARQVGFEVPHQPRKSWYWNLERVSANGDHEAIFHLKQPQPALVALLASGYSPVYPCHVPPQEMRQHPIGTGPFKFVSYKPNEAIQLTRNPDYWKPGRPYLEGIEWTIIPNRSTALLAFVAGKLDMTFPYEVTVPLLKDIERKIRRRFASCGQEVSAAP
jgi:peptide/nickel transport system substrate-binding protein